MLPKHWPFQTPTAIPGRWEIDDFGQPESCGHFHGGIFTTQAIIMGELVLIEGVNPVP